MGVPKTNDNAKANATAVEDQAFNADVIFSLIGKTGRYQWRFWFFMGFTLLFPASAVLVYTFTGNLPAYRCFFDGIDNETSVYEADWLNRTVPVGHSVDQLNQCQRFNVTWEDIANGIDLSYSVIPCDRWIFDRSVFEETAATAFVLTCDNEWKNTFVGTLTMIGMMVGSFFLGPLADIFGRRLGFLLLSVWLSVFAVSSSFAPDFDSFAALRFFTGMGGIAMVSTNNIWGLEFMVPEIRTKYVFVLYLCQTIGSLLTGMVAYFIRDWRTVHLIVFCPMVLLISYYFLLPESPRWLIFRKKYAEARAVFEHGARVNGVVLPPHLLEIPENEKAASKMEQAERKDGEAAPAASETIAGVFKTPCLLKRLLVLCMAWISSMLCYYGLAYSSSNLAGDIFLNFILVSLAEVPAFLIGMFVVEWTGRRPIANVCLMGAGIFCLAAGLVPQEQTTVVVVCSLLGKFFSAMQNVTIVMQTSELFHTPVRGIVVALCSTAGKVGGILAPVVATLGKTNPAFPYLVFGILNIIVGLLSLLLPESKGSPLPSTFAEAVELEKRTLSMRACRKRRSQSLSVSD